MAENATTIEFDEWERSALHTIAAGNALTYLGHYRGSGLFRREIPTLNNWRRLTAKLSGKEYEGDLPYRGIARNGFNPQGDD